MDGIFTHIYRKNLPNVGKCTSPMDAMGSKSQRKRHPNFCLGTTRFTASEAQQTRILAVTEAFKVRAGDVGDAHVQPMNHQAASLLKQVIKIMFSRLVYVYVVLHIYSVKNI